MILVLVGLATKEAWYLGVQDWMLKKRAVDGELSRTQTSWTHWIEDSDTIGASLSSELKLIARWQGETQLVLSLRDALRAAVGTYSKSAMSAVVELIVSVAPTVADISVDVIVDEAVRMGNNLRGTVEGNAVADQLFALARRFGGRLSLATVADIVMREGS